MSTEDTHIRQKHLGVEAILNLLNLQHTNQISENTVDLLFHDDIYKISDNTIFTVSDADRIPPKLVRLPRQKVNRGKTLTIPIAYIDPDTPFSQITITKRGHGTLTRESNRYVLTISPPLVPDQNYVAITWSTILTISDARDPQPSGKTDNMTIMTDILAHVSIEPQIVYPDEITVTGPMYYHGEPGYTIFSLSLRTINDPEKSFDIPEPIATGIRGQKINWTWRVLTNPINFTTSTINSRFMTSFLFKRFWVFRRFESKAYASNYWPIPDMKIEISATDTLNGITTTIKKQVTVKFRWDNTIIET